MVESSSNAPYRSQKFKAKGQAVLRSHRDQPESDLSCSFTHLSYSFPLKLLSPRITSKDALNSARRQRLKTQLSSDDTTLPKKDSSSSKALNGSDAPYIFSLEEEAERVEREKERVSTSKISSDKVESKPYQDKAIAALFIVGYGGGLVSGDSISLEIDVGSDSTLLLLTQGSTKVFKSRKSFSSKQELTLEKKQISNQSRLEQTSNSSSLDQSSSSTSTHDSNSNPAPSKILVESNPTTSQIFKCLIRKDSTLILLPDPVTCFTNSKYYQTQFFDLRDKETSSLVLLDWITPGRMLSVGSELGHGRGNVGFEKQSKDGKQGTSEEEEKVKYGQHSGPELWQFESYRSRNEIRVQGEIVVRDLLFLDQEIINQTSNPFSNLSNSSPNSSRKTDSTSLATRLYPYTCYATLFLFGPDCKSTIDHLKQLYRRIQQRILIKPQDLIWSCSELGPGGGISKTNQTPDVEANEKEKEEGPGDLKEIPEALVIRIAGKETELVRDWLRENLWELKKVVGSDLYKTALG